MRAGIVASAVLGVPLTVGAQEPTPEVPLSTEELADMSLEELLDMPVQVATGKGSSLHQRESPGIIAVITHEQIQSSGARDLYELLELLPGFSVSSDVQGTLGPSVRGIWAQEGKVLVNIDDVPVNDLLYGNPIFAKAEFLDDIERIEIIRGPGSALYGGFAELSVVNIITRSGAAVGGARVGLSYGQMPDSYGARQVTLSVGQKLGEVELVLHAGLGDGHRSDRSFTESDGQEFPLPRFGGMDAWTVNLGLAYEGLSLRLLADHYRLASTQLEDPSGPIRTEFVSYIADAKYEIRLHDKLTLVPEARYMWASTWRTAGAFEREAGWYYEIPASRVTTRLSARYDATATLSLTAGAEFYWDHAYIADDAEPGTVLEGGATEVDYQNVAGFAQGLLRHRFVTVTAGARYDYHSAFGGVFVPRLGLTKVVGRFHFKALAARAYRAPTIENLNIRPDIKPEYTTSFELEAGYQASANLFVSVNAFDLGVRDVIVYSVTNETSDYTYINFPHVGSRGVEAQVRLQGRLGRADLSYSFYRAYDNQVELYEARDDAGRLVGGALLGAANHQVKLNASIVPVAKLKGLSINPTAILTSPRYGRRWSEAAMAPVPHEFGAQLRANLNVVYRDLGIDGLDAAIGVYDLLGVDHDYLPGYDNGDGPLPGRSRELVGRIGYRAGF